MAEIFAERVLQLREGETSKPVRVRVYKPERHPDQQVEAWTCRADWDGAELPACSGFGTDSAEALFNALDAVGEQVRQHDELRSVHEREAPGERSNPWPIEPGPRALPVPEPLPGDVILERMLVAPGSSERNARVAVHRPQPKGADKWICWYEIQIPGRPDRRYRGTGVDSAQALFHALVRAKWDIEAHGLTHPHVKNPWEICLESSDEPPPDTDADTE